MKYITYRTDRQVYQIKIHVGRGKERRQIVRQAKTAEEAENIRNELLRLNRIDPAILADKPVKAVDTEKRIEPKTFREAFEQWFDEEVKVKAKVNTIGNYHATMLLFFPIVGSMAPNKISHDILQDIFKAVQELHGYTEGYMRSHLGRIRRMYVWGIANGWYKMNPCVDIRLISTEPIPKRALTHDEMRQFFAKAKEYKGNWYLLFFLYKETGARRGEIAGLRWMDVDFQGKCIHINEALKYDYVNHRQVLGCTKTKASVRTIPISDRMLFALQMRKKLGHYNDQRYVFEQNNGQPLRDLRIYLICLPIFATLLA
jgi:integrase